MTLVTDSFSIQAPAKKWDPGPFLYDSESAVNVKEARHAAKVALVIINTPIVRKDVFETIWANAKLKYCADGGANRLYDAFGEDVRYIPDLIKGDLDSLRHDVREYYESKSVPVVLDDDQYATDLGKCIKSLIEVEKQTDEQYQLVIYGGLSGRLDQTAHTLHVLHKLRKERETTWVVSEESLTCVLDNGKHRLHMPKRLVGKTCGILPLGIDSAYVVTKGLEWDLPIEDGRTSMDTMVSTSNHLVDEFVELTTDRPVVWTAELRKQGSLPSSQ